VFLATIVSSHNILGSLMRNYGSRIPYIANDKKSKNGERASGVLAGIFSVL